MSRQLPKSVLLEDAKKIAQEKYDRVQSTLQRDVAKIAELRNISISSVEQLEAMSPGWLDDEISKGREKLSTLFGEGGGFVPAGIVKQFSDEFERARTEGREPIEGIMSGLAWCKERGIGIKIDSKGRPWLDEKAVREAVAKEATYKFSEKEGDFYELLNSVFQALDSVRKYERDNGFEISDLQALIPSQITAVHLSRRMSYQMTPEEFIAYIRFGKIMRQREADNNTDTEA